MSIYKHLFGPVASRRLGRSLGIDLLPFKTCTLDCVYCECGRTTDLTCARRDFFDPQEVLDELRRWKAEGGEADIVTLAGSGEPLLAQSVGLVISEARRITGLPVCLITNATLFSDPECRQAALKADVVVPSLDAADERTFKRINRPAPDLSFAAYLEGLLEFSKAYRGRGKLNLEIFLVPGINDNEEQIRALSLLALSLHPTVVQLNTAVRPPADADVRPIPREEMERWATYFMPTAQVIASYAGQAAGKERHLTREEVLAAIRHRVCSLEDIVKGQGLPEAEAREIVAGLLKEGLVRVRRQDGQDFYYV